jgi:lysyl-tRNA synthetase class 2
MAAIIWSPIALLPYCPIALFMISASPWWTRHVHVDRRPRLMARNAIQNGLRQWFAERDFVEVTANTLQVSPGNEAHLSAFGTEFLHPDGSRRPYYLHTSPEFACKKLLAAGEPRLFSLGPVYRNRERGPLHHPEFTMLEWYRAGEPYDVLMRDCAAFLALAADRAGTKNLLFGGARPTLTPSRSGSASLKLSIVLRASICWRR